MTHPVPLRLPSSVARSRLSEIITRVQDPRAFVVLTRHDKPVAAVVSMAELHRIWSSQDIEDVVAHGKSPVMFRLGKTGCLTQREAAERILQVQMDRRMEREVLTGAGLAPVPGGELEVEAEAAAPRRPWWAFWRRGG